MTTCGIFDPHPVLGYCRTCGCERDRHRRRIRQPRLSITAILMITLAACGGWSRRDTALEAAYIAAVTSDYAQTRAIVADRNEVNPLIGPDGRRTPIAVYFPVMAALHFTVSAVLPRGWTRSAWQAFTLGYEVEVVYANVRHGYGLLGGVATAPSMPEAPPAPTNGGGPPCYVCTH